MGKCFNSLLVLFILALAVESLEIISASRCKPVTCRLYCPFGFQQDSDGCDICACKPNPCEGRICQSGQTCQLQDVVCKKAPCYPVGVCNDTICHLAVDPGLCKAAFPKYYFDATAGDCKKFTYGGCEGNANRFSTLEECRRACGCKQWSCYMNPCDTASCPAFPSATCRPNYCGGCFAEFFVGDRKVDCKLPTCGVLQKCYTVLCLLPDDHQCVNNDECPPGTTCCRNCCDRKCKPNTHDGFCPQPLFYQFNCKTPELPVNCVGDYQCAKDEKCCVHSDGCRYCDKSFKVPPIG